MKEFLKKILLLTAVVLATVSVMALCNLYFSPIYYPVTIYFLISVVLMYYVFHNIMQKNPKRFSSMFLLISFGKMFLDIVVLFLFVCYSHADLKMLLAYFVVMYLIYTVFVVVSLVKMIKNSAKK